MRGQQLGHGDQVVSRLRGARDNSLVGLSCGLVSAEGGLVGSGTWLLGVLLLLGDQSNSSLVALSSLDSDSLLVDETGVLAGMLVDQVHRIARESDTSRLGALHKEGILGSDDLPDQVRRHLARVVWHFCGELI